MHGPKNKIEIYYIYFLRIQPSAMGLGSLCRYHLPKPKHLPQKIQFWSNQRHSEDV